MGCLPSSFKVTSHYFSDHSICGCEREITWMGAQRALCERCAQCEHCAPNQPLRTSLPEFPLADQSSIGKWWWVSEMNARPSKTHTHSQIEIENISAFGPGMYCFELLVVLGLVFVQSPD